ncbi:MAG: IreB family regulatory phosphoprotein [Defluviitaleaceae bacterium]|nr:IreB family regulatory phosphoprotein [Defluviitaleaceae bacterium]
MGNNNLSQTQRFTDFEKMPKPEVREIITCVYDALNEKGYNPINQIVGYILSGDPTYITSHKNARSMIGKLERDELLEEIIKYYIRGLN